MRLTFLAVLCAAACAPHLPRVRSPQVCCEARGDADRLDGRRVMVEGVYAPGPPVGVKGTSSFVAIHDDSRPADEAEKLAGRHVLVLGRLRDGRLTEIERIDVY